MSYQTLQTPYGATIAYHQTEAQNTNLPGVIFLGGFMSDMTGSKATFLEEQCKNRGQGYIRFDYTGHGSSSGQFVDGTIGSWTQDTLFMIDHLAQGSQILIGSSMGGWIALLAALSKPGRVAGIIGIAAAPDFTEDLFQTTFTDEQRRTVEEEGIIYMPSNYGDPYPMTKALFEDGRQHCLLDNAIDIHCPVRLIYSKADEIVPWEKALRVEDKLTSQDTKVIFVEESDHSISRPQDLELINETLCALNENKSQKAQTA